MLAKLLPSGARFLTLGGLNEILVHYKHKQFLK